MESGLLAIVLGFTSVVMKSFLFSECIDISYTFLSLQRLFSMLRNYHSFIILFTILILWQPLKYALKDTCVESYQTLPGMFRSFLLLSEHWAQCKYYLSSLLGLCLSYILSIKYSAWHIVGCQCISVGFGAAGGGVGWREQHFWTGQSWLGGPEVADWADIELLRCPILMWEIPFILVTLSVEVFIYGTVFNKGSQDFRTMLKLRQFNTQALIVQSKLWLQRLTHTSTVTLPGNIRDCIWIWVSCIPVHRSWLFLLDTQIARWFYTYTYTHTPPLLMNWFNQCNC